MGRGGDGEKASVHNPPPKKRPLQSKAGTLHFFLVVTTTPCGLFARGNPQRRSQKRGSGLGMPASARTCVDEKVMRRADYVIVGAGSAGESQSAVPPHATARASPSLLTSDLLA